MDIAAAGLAVSRIDEGTPTILHHPETISNEDPNLDDAVLPRIETVRLNINERKLEGYAYGAPVLPAPPIAPGGDIFPVAAATAFLNSPIVVPSSPPANVVARSTSFRRSGVRTYHIANGARARAVLHASPADCRRTGWASRLVKMSERVPSSGL